MALDSEPHHKITEHSDALRAIMKLKEAGKIPQYPFTGGDIVALVHQIGESVSIKETCAVLRAVGGIRRPDWRWEPVSVDVGMDKAHALILEYLDADDQNGSVPDRG